MLFYVDIRTPLLTILLVFTGICKELSAQTETTDKLEKAYLYYVTCAQPAGCKPFMWIGPIEVYTGKKALEDHTAEVRKSAPDELQKEIDCVCNAELGIVIREYKTEAEAHEAKQQLINKSVAANKLQVFFSNNTHTTWNIDAPSYSMTLENAPPEIQASLMPYKLNAGIEWYNRGDYESAFKLFTKIASQDYAPAYFWVGRLYYEGKGVQQNYTKAAEWLLKGEKAKDPEALYLLGLLYYEGKGVKVDKAKGVSKINDAAKYLHNEALIFLLNNTDDGKLLKEGIDYLKLSDHAAAFPLVRQAALHKFDIAYFYLGTMYLAGEGVDPNYAEAIQWFEQSASAGHAIGKYALGVSYWEGLGVPVDEAKGALLILEAHKMGYEEATNKLVELGFLDKR